MALVMVSCNQKNKQVDSDSMPMMHDSTMIMHDSTMMHKDSTMMNQHAKMYSCPMHPEVQGKLNESCSKCGMDLNVEVK